MHNGEERELYGRRLEAEIFLETVCPRRLGAEGCMEQTDAIVQRFSEPVNGVSLTEFTVGACAFDETADAFTMTVTAKLKAYLYALSEEDGTEFTDFILKGEIL